ncbi:MAG: hypothetical protein ACR2OJ_14385 [Hyphomicrobiales bacterium]
MNKATIGVIWAISFVLLESIQFVYFGGLFQRMSSFLFGFLMFGVTCIVFIGWTAWTRPNELRIAFANPKTLLAVNISATLAWAAYLTSVQLIEPAIAYTIGAGAMPLTACLAHKFGAKGGTALRNNMEALGVCLLLAGMIYLSVATIGGWSGFVRGGTPVAIAGICFALADGALFTLMLIYCQRLDEAGVGPASVFGLRFPLYVLTAGCFVFAGVGARDPLPIAEISLLVGIGLLLTIPPLYALQKAVASISTLTIGALTALGPFVIFALQMVEGRVSYSAVTLAGLFVYFVGALLTALGAVKSTIQAS